MVYLILSLVVLWSSPWLYQTLQARTSYQRLLERTMVAAIAGLIVFGILPDSYALVGGWAILVAGFGMLLPSLVERTWSRLAERVHWVPVMLGMIGLALHAALDGAAFVSPELMHTHGFESGEHGNTLLPLAVLAHRFFEGVFIWWALQPRFGWRGAAGGLAFISAFTLAGYVAGEFLFHEMHEATAFGVFQALVAGSLLHVVLDRHTPGGKHDHGGHAHDHHVGHAGHGHRGEPSKVPTSHKAALSKGPHTH